MPGPCLGMPGPAGAYVHKYARVGGSPRKVLALLEKVHPTMLYKSLINLAKIFEGYPPIPLMPALVIVQIIFAAHAKVRQD